MFSFQSAFVSFVYLKQPIYYITVFWFCQVLFQKFLWFFYLVFKSIYCFIQSIPIGFLYSFGRLVYYITYLSFCQVLFSTFFKIFLWLSLSQDDLIIISQLFWFVKHFWKIFWIFSKTFYNIREQYYYTWKTKKSQ